MSNANSLLVGNHFLIFFKKFIREFIFTSFKFSAWIKQVLNFLINFSTNTQNYLINNKGLTLFGILLPCDGMVGSEISSNVLLFSFHQFMIKQTIHLATLLTKELYNNKVPRA